MRDEPRVSELLSELDAIEARLDPRPLRAGRVIADLVTVALLFFLATVLDWPIRSPLLLLSLLLAGTGLSRLIPYLNRRALRRQRDRLTAEYRALERPESSRADN